MVDRILEQITEQAMLSAKGADEREKMSLSKIYEKMQSEVNCGVEEKVDNKDYYVE